MLHADVRQRDDRAHEDEHRDPESARSQHGSARSSSGVCDPAAEHDDAQHQQQVCELEAEVEAERHLPGGHEPAGDDQTPAATSVAAHQEEERERDPARGEDL